MYEQLNIDWEEFKNQKEWLAGVAAHHFFCTGQELESAEGILNFLDAFQDASENGGLYRADTTYQPEEQGS